MYIYEMVSPQFVDQPEYIYINHKPNSVWNHKVKTNLAKTIGFPTRLPWTAAGRRHQVAPDVQGRAGGVRTLYFSPLLLGRSKWSFPSMGVPQKRMV